MKLILLIVIASVVGVLTEEYDDEGPPEYPDDHDLESQESFRFTDGFDRPYHKWGNHQDNEKHFDYLFGKGISSISSISSSSFGETPRLNQIPSDGKLDAAASISDGSEVRTKSFTAPSDSEDNNYGYRPDSEYPPNQWSEKWPQCGGGRQSPIDLSLPSCDRDFGPPLQPVFFKKNPHTTTIRNLGHTIQYSFAYNGSSPILAGGFLEAEYIFAQLHFHFGSNDYSGSEHSVNGISYPMEMHLVFYNSNYNSTEDASQHADGLVVLGVFFQVLERTANQRFALYLSDVPTDGSEVRLQNPRSHRLFDFVGSMDFHYATYEGSLTTPPCSEAVTWIVSTRSREISRQDLENFRSLQGYEGLMSDNNRPLQRNNGRTCLYH
ncbi:Carbonic anhydrase [Sergentomyia squamirostris]